MESGVEGGETYGSTEDPAKIADGGASCSGTWRLDSSKNKSSRAASDVDWYSKNVRFRDRLGDIWPGGQKKSTLTYA